jgi:hypothetical protein
MSRFKMVSLAIIGLILILALGYTIFSIKRNSLARYWGGSIIINVPQNHKVLNASWKGTSIWVLSQDTITGKTVFWESSSWGIAEGTVKFQ